MICGTSVRRNDAPLENKCLLTTIKLQFNYGSVRSSVPTR